LDEKGGGTATGGAVVALAGSESAITVILPTVHGLIIM